MTDGTVTVLVGTTKGAFLVSGGDGPQRLEGEGAVLRRLADQPRDRRSRDRHVVGRRRRRLVRGGGLALGGWRRDLGAVEAHQGHDGRLGGERCGLCRDDRLDRHAAALRRPVLAGLVAALRPRHALCRHQAGQAPRQQGRRQDVGASRGPGQPSLRRSWNPGAAGLVLHTIVSDPADPNKTLDRDFGGGRLRHRGRRPELGAPQPPVQCRACADITPSGRARATARPAIASTT